VNTFRNPNAGAEPEAIELARSTDAEKRSQLERLHAFWERHQQQAPAILERLRRVVIEDGNTFEVLMDAVRYCSLGQITQTLYEVGGRYRRNM
jgi:isobutyryl-CoA mutase